MSAVPEDTVIVDLRDKKSIELTCPITEDGDQIGFATWYQKKKETDREKEIIYLQGRYDFPSVAGLLIENLQPEDEGLYICKEGMNSKAMKKFRVLILGKCSC